MSLYFENIDYRKKALEDAKREYLGRHSVKEAFFLLIKDATPADLFHLCKLVQSRYPSLSIHDCYLLTHSLQEHQRMILPFFLNIILLPSMI